MNKLNLTFPRTPPIQTLLHIQPIPIRHSPQRPISRPPIGAFFATNQRQHQQSQSPPASAEQSPTEHKSINPEPPPAKSTHQQSLKSLAERDADHLAKMREAMGGADHSNVEMEDGVPDRGMKRNVRENMFRII